MWGERNGYALWRSGPDREDDSGDDRDHDRAGAEGPRGRCRTAYENEPAIKALIDTAMRLEGLIRGAGVHAAGVVIAPQPAYGDGSGDADEG